MSIERTMRWIATACVVAACGGGADAPDAGDDDRPDGGAGEAAPESAGLIEVVEASWTYDDGAGGDVVSRWSQVTARFYDGLPPAFHSIEAEAGDCVLRRYTPAACTPECATGLCVDPGVCEPWPTRRSAGTLTLGGARETVTIVPQDGYYATSEPLPEDLFADDARLTAALAGADVPATTLAADATAPLAAAIEHGRIEIPYPAGQDFVVAWTPAGAGGRVRLTLNANNQGHGMPYAAILECDVADAAGEVAIPAALLDAFPETLAWTVCAGSDCPPSTLRRYHHARVDVGGGDEVVLVVGSQVNFGVDHVLE